MYIPGFSNMLMQPENMGGPAQVSMDDILAQYGIQPSAPAQLPPSVRPSAPAIMQTPPAGRGALGIDDAMLARVGAPVNARALEFARNARAQVQPENIGGPARVARTNSLLPIAPAIMQAPLSAFGANNIGNPADGNPAGSGPASAFQPTPGSAMMTSNMRGTAPTAAPTTASTAAQVQPPSGGFSAVDFANMLSTAPGAAGNTIDFETGARYGLTPTGLATRDGQQGVNFYNEQGWRGGKNIGGSGKGEITGFVAADPNAQYRLRDGNQVTTEGSGLDGLLGVKTASSKLTFDGGEDADWTAERLNPATGQWEPIAKNKPTTIMDQLGPALDIALPVALSLAVPGLGLVGSKVLAAGLGAAGGSALSSAAQGRSLKETLKRAAISGVVTAAGAGVGGKLGAGLNKAAPVAGKTTGQIVASTTGQTAGQTAGDIIVSRSLGALAGSKTGAVAGGALSNLADMAPDKGADFADSISEQPTTPVVPDAPDVFYDGAIDILGDRISPPLSTTPETAIGSAVAAGAGNVFNDPNGGNQIIAEQPRTIQQEFDAAFPNPLSAVPLTPDDVASDFDKEFGEKSLRDRLQEGLRGLSVSDYLRLSGLLLPLLDGGGGGGRRGSRTIPGGMFGGLSVFGRSLPRATLPGASTGFAPRAPSTLRPQTAQDYYRYGYGPAQSFFSYVPEGEANTSQAFTGYAVGGMAGGGDMAGMARNSFAVNGPGAGRSDEIPAMLSDGEYVIDAETVALLGDGSSKAGANRLDNFRMNVRKDKGRNLARGDFSVNAKRPEQYLKGGRA